MKIEELRIKNFRAIGGGPDGDGIVIRFSENNLIFLSGENNTGKSSVLVAYDSFVTADFKPTECDFHEKNPETPIEIEAWIRAESRPPDIPPTQNVRFPRQAPWGETA